LIALVEHYCLGDDSNEYGAFCHSSLRPSCCRRITPSGFGVYGRYHIHEKSSVALGQGRTDGSLVPPRAGLKPGTYTRRAESFQDRIVPH
jgi:hypothetical protein